MGAPVTPAVIEMWLLTQFRWVPASEICQRFGVVERSLRATGAKPGLLSHCAISGDSGFKHVRHATTAEWLRCKGRLARHGELSGRRPSWEKHTGQGVLI